MDLFRLFSESIFGRRAFAGLGLDSNLLPNPRLSVNHEDFGAYYRVDEQFETGLRNFNRSNTNQSP